LENSPAADQRRVYLTQDILNWIMPVTLERFQPELGQATAYKWTDPDNGTQLEYDMPPYRISDMREATINVGMLIKFAQMQFTGQLLEDSNPIIKMVFDEARRYCEVSKVQLPCRCCF
jgi:hypothetical protein